MASVIVLGAGPAGILAAHRAAELGAGGDNQYSFVKLYESVGKSGTSQLHRRASILEEPLA